MRNKDVGFLTWSSALLADLRWFLALVPIVILTSFFIEIKFFLAANISYLSFLIILWLLTRSVIHKRELLADKTVGLLIEFGKIAETIDIQQVSLAGKLHMNIQQKRTSTLLAKIRNWICPRVLTIAGSKSCVRWACRD